MRLHPGWCGAAAGLALLGMACPTPAPPRSAPRPPRREAAPPPAASGGVRTPSPEAYLRFLRAELALARGERAAATRHYRAALLEDPDSPELRLRLAGLALLAGRRREAARLARAAQRASPGYPPALLFSARLLRGAAPARAAALLREALAQDPRRADAHLQLAPLVRRLAGARAEQRIYEGLLRVRPEHLAGLLGLARSLARQGRPEEAARALAQASQAHPFALDPWIGLARLRIGQGQPDAAARALYDGLEATGDDFSVAEELFRLWLARGRPERARDVIVLLEGHASADVLTFAAGLYERLGETGAARAALQQARRQDPGYGPALVAHARLLRRTGAVTEARRLLETAGPGASLRAAAELELAAALVEDGEHAGAERLLRGLLARKAEESGAAEALAFLLARTGRFRAGLAALEAARRARGLAPDDPAHRYSLALLHEEAGRFWEAARLARALLADDPDDAQALNLLGYGLADRGLDLQRAERLLDRALGLDPFSPYLLDSAGWVRYRQGRPGAAIPFLARAVQVDRRLCEGWAHLGEAHLAAGRPAAARRAFGAGLTCGPAASLAAVLRGRLRALETPGTGAAAPFAPRARTRSFR